MQKYFSLIRGVGFSVIMFCTSACSKSFVTNVASPSQILESGYFANKDNFKAALTGIYGTLRLRYNNFWKMAEVPSDNTLAAGSVTADTGPLDQFSWTSTDRNILSEWQGEYQTIAHCNNFLDQIQDFNLGDSTLKKQWIGEAKWIRALAYFNLVRFFGNVPLVVTKIKTDAEAYAYKRDSVSKIYDQIIKDLIAAEECLPINYTISSDVGRVTSGAAKALLGKVYLTQNRWDDAANKLSELINLNTYSLVPTFGDVFSTTNEANAEIIFSVQYSRGTAKEGSAFTQSFLPTTLPFLITLAPRGSNQGTKNLFDAFETNDARKATCIQRYGSYYTRKFMDNPPSVNEGENNWIVLRHADVLLMYAEALEEQGTAASISQSIDIVNNQIRKRAGLAPISKSLSQANLRLAIEKERRLELCFEGHRWFDLIRTNRMESVMKAQFFADNLPYTVIPERALFPIPFRELTINPKLEQNPGYN